MREHFKEINVFLLKNILLHSIVICFLVFILINTAQADEWIIYGARSSGMGGTGVANENGAISSYWNPANLSHYQRRLSEIEEPGVYEPGSLLEQKAKRIKAKKEHLNYSAFSTWDASINLTFIPAIEGNLLPRIDALISIWRYLDTETLPSDPTMTAWDVLDEALGRPVPVWTGIGGVPGDDIKKEWLEAVSALLGNMISLNKPGHGATTTLGTGLNVRIDNFAFQTSAYLYMSVYPLIDFTNSGLTMQDLDDFAAALVVLGFTPGSAPTTPGGIALRNLIAAQEAAYGIDNNFMPAFNTTDMLAYFFEDASKNTGFSLEDPVILDGIIRILDPTNPPAFLLGSDPFTGNLTSLVVKGITILEAVVSAGYGFEIGEIIEQILVGINGRFLVGRPFEKIYLFSDGDGQLQGDDFIDDVLDPLFSSNALAQINLSFDIGLTFVFYDGRIRVSVVGRNITQPDFKYDDGSTYEVKALYRAGFAFEVVRNVLTFALDMDLNASEATYMPNYKNQMIGCGFEVKPYTGEYFGFAFRLGAMTNFASKYGEFTYTTGFGLRFWKLQLDFAAAISPAYYREKYSSAVYYQEGFLEDLGWPVPQRVLLGFSLSFNATW